jgi:hypothetical protein
VTVLLITLPNAASIWQPLFQMGVVSSNAGATHSELSSVVVPPAPDPAPDSGAPILILGAASNPFSTYLAEILRAEGLNLFAVKEVGTVTPDTLANVDVVVLGEVPLSTNVVATLTEWVNAGGTLIALRPSHRLADLLGIAVAADSTSNGYLRVNTDSGAGVGIVGETMQFHGTADHFTLKSATPVAMLYSTADSATAFPAVTTRTVGVHGGRAIAFTFDLARSIVYTRQGNPAWSGQERDGTAPIRSNDMFYGHAAADPQPDWVDPSRIAIPQADEQQRLLANLILQGSIHRMPLPRFWYFPKGKKAVVIMTGDNHGAAGMSPRFEIYRRESPANCSEPDWECVRATGYEYVRAAFTPSQAMFYDRMGFEVGVHLTTGCLDFSPAALDSTLSVQLAAFGSFLPGVPAPATSRTHCIAWSDWSTAAEVEARHGIRFDTNYYYWPPQWVQDRPGLFTGSGMPMRFAKVDGTIIDCYQATTQMTDESGQTYPMTSDSLLTRALDARGYYGAFCANMHFDNPDHPISNAIVASALARGVPVVSARQMLTWLDARNASAFGDLSWSDNTLSFSISVAPAAQNLQAMLPMLAAASRLTGLIHEGVSIPFSTETIKGMEYACFRAEHGHYTAIYSGSLTLGPGSGSTRAAVGSASLDPLHKATSTHR